MRLPTCAALAATALLFTLAGCGDKSDDSSDPGPTVTTTATATVTETASPSPSTSETSASTPSTAACRTADLRVRLLPGEGAAGSTYFPLRLTNTSSSPCTTRGYGGVSLVAGATGSPIGAPADRTKATAKSVVLEPGDSATATLRVVNAENYSSGKCRPRTAAGFRVYPPDETHSAFVRKSTPACAAASVHLLSLTPYKRG